VRVLVTGACGFVGSAVCAALLGRGHDVVGVDALIPQAHGPRAVEAGARLTDGAVHRVDLRDKEKLEAVLAGVDVVCHQAALVGAGVAVADLPLYAAHNDLGTATLLAAMSEHDIRRLVLASSMVVYGEGRYACAEHGPVEAGLRAPAALAAGEFDHACPACDRPLPWDRVDESAPLRPRTAYAASKVAQEHYAAAWAAHVQGQVVALRYHNVYGPWMPQDTPYSGVAAMFRSSVERGEPPQVYEDGRQMRDFVHVSDVARANALAVEHVQADHAGPMAAFNVCSGSPISILEVAECLCATLGGTVGGDAPQVTGAFRPGDVRHVVASPARAAETLGFVATVRPGAGIEEFATAPLRRATWPLRLPVGDVQMLQEQSQRRLRR
jgi:dTDP-L-rhamnose 4-epimerase